MSIAIMTLVWGVDLPDSEKIVLLALADCANDEGVCWPSMASLVRKCSKSDRTVQAAIKSLVATGHMSREERPGKGVLYTIHPRSDVAPEATSPPKRRRPEMASPPKGTTGTPEAASDKPSRTPIIPDADASGGAAPRPTMPIDLKADIFQAGVALLTKSGRAAPDARKLIGMWKKQYRDADIMDALAAAQAEGTPDPVPYIRRVLESRNGKRPHHDRPAGAIESRHRLRALHDVDDGCGEAYG